MSFIKVMEILLHKQSDNFKFLTNSNMKLLIISNMKPSNEAFFAQIIYYLSFNYFWKSPKYTSFFTAYVRKKWVFNQFSVLKVI